MSRFSIDLKELHQLEKMLAADIPERVKVQVRKVTLEFARLVRTTAIERIQQSVPTGRVYSRSNHRRTHVASAPWQPPADDLGSFVRSIYLAHTKEGYRVGTLDFRGAMFEFGTNNTPGYIAPRPWLFPALEEATPQLPAIIDRFMGDII
jgi:hypothetical protein